MSSCRATNANTSTVRTAALLRRPWLPTSARDLTAGARGCRKRVRDDGRGGTQAEVRRARQVRLTKPAQPRKADILDSHAARARKIRELTARLKIASRAVGLEIVPEHDSYPGSPEQALVYAARDACDLTKPLKKGKAKR